MHQESKTKSHEPTATPLIFVYGTLRCGASNHFRMEGMELLASARVRGRLYRVDWYPALVLDPDAGAVVGEIYQIQNRSLSALDEYEGPQYRRVLSTATDMHGQDHEVWLWEWLDSIETLQPIPNGDWLHPAGV